MRVYLKYNEKGTPAITNVQRVSRPSRRIYTKSDSIPSIRNGFGISIMSTNKGIMSGDAAKEQKVGGEILCKIW